MSLQANAWQISITNLRCFVVFFLRKSKWLAAEIHTIKLYKCALNPLDCSANSQMVFNIGEVFLLLIKCVIKCIDSLVTLSEMRDNESFFEDLLEVSIIFSLSSIMWRRRRVCCQLCSSASWPILWAQRYSFEYLLRFFPTRRASGQWTLY